MTSTSKPETVGAAVAKREAPTAGGMVQQYRSDFTTVLPSHVKPETWLRLAQGALRRGKKVKAPDGRMMTELEIGALNNPAAFLVSLLESARLGLEPGTEQYYLTPCKVKGQLEILGIVGYQGYIELMYRAGAISSVIAEVVYANDVFRYQPGRDEIPHHEIDWDSADRGPLRLAYAYARMKDGAVSKVIVLNKVAVDAIKKSSQGADSDYSPWKNHEASMWLKSAVRQLQKWVPTSAEYIREQLRAEREVAAEVAAPAPLQVDLDYPGAVDQATGEVYDAEIVEPTPADLAAMNAEAAIDARDAR